MLRIACSDNMSINCADIVDIINESYDTKGGGSKTFAMIGKIPDINTLESIKETIKEIAQLQLDKK